MRQKKLRPEKNAKNLAIIFPFRSFHNQKINYRVSLFLLLPFFFNGIILYCLDYITQGWGFIIQYALSLLSVPGTVIYTEYSIFHVNFMLPAIVLPASPPTMHLSLITFFITLGSALVSHFFTNAWTPLKYFIRAAIIIFWSTLLFFYFNPTGFPYDLTIYSKSGFLQIIALLLATPWIYCFTYYVYGYHLISKFALTGLMLNYLIILAPFQYLTNALIIHLGSLLFMPFLYFFAGLLLNIMAIIAFYAYGISLVHHYPKWKTVRSEA